MKILGFYGLFVLFIKESLFVLWIFFHLGLVSFSLNQSMEFCSHVWTCAVNFYLNMWVILQLGTQEMPFTHCSPSFIDQI